LPQKTGTGRAKERMRRNRWSAPNARPLEVSAHHLLCAVCTRGGCKNPPPGRKAVERLLSAMWSYPYVSLKICADVDIQRAHFLDVYEGRDKKRLPRDFAERRANYMWRRKDLEVCRVLGIMPNTELPAFFAYDILFARQKTLEGICRSDSRKSAAWPECPHARKGYYEKIAGGPRYTLEDQTRLGERLDGQGLWAMLRPRTRQDMKIAKERSAKQLMEKAGTLYMRPQHALCLLCRKDMSKPLIEDNLIEMRRRMEANPDIPVTLVEGCCQVCDPCNEYHAGEHLCYHTHAKNSLRDLMILERLGLAPGATLPARKLYELLYKRIHSLKEICGWRDGSNTAPFWAPCAYDLPHLDDARKAGLLTGKSRARKGKSKGSGD